MRVCEREGERGRERGREGERERGREREGGREMACIDSHALCTSDVMTSGTT